MSSEAAKSKLKKQNGGNRFKSDPRSVWQIFRHRRDVNNPKTRFDRFANVALSTIKWFKSQVTSSLELKYWKTQFIKIPPYMNALTHCINTDYLIFKICSLLLPRARAADFLRFSYLEPWRFLLFCPLSDDSSFQQQHEVSGSWKV